MYYVVLCTIYVHFFGDAHFHTMYMLKKRQQTQATTMAEVVRHLPTLRCRCSSRHIWESFFCFFGNICVHTKLRPESFFIQNFDILWQIIHIYNVLRCFMYNLRHFLGRCTLSYYVYVKKTPTNTSHYNGLGGKALAIPSGAGVRAATIENIFLLFWKHLCSY